MKNFLCREKHSTTSLMQKMQVNPTRTTQENWAMLYSKVKSRSIIDSNISHLSLIFLLQYLFTVEAFLQEISFPQ